MVLTQAETGALRRALLHDLNGNMTPFARFLVPATASPELWRLFLGCVVIAASVIFGTTLLSMIPFQFWPAAEANRILNDMIYGTSRFGMALALFTFAFMLGGTWIAARLLHGRGLGSLFGPWPEVRRGFVYGATVCTFALCVILAIWSMFYDAVPKSPLRTVILFLPLAVILIALQTAAEEVIFRGYLPQQLAARFRHPAIWFVLPQVLFGLLHYDTETLGPWLWPYLAIITLNGLVWMDLVRITGNLGIAWGWHFANNLFVMTVLGAPDYLSGYLWLATPYATVNAPGLVVAVDAISVVLVWLILRRALLRPVAA